MPPALHPRSRQTFSLFTTTLAISFLVVGLPHVLPCPVPYTAFADGDNPSEAKTIRRRRHDDNNADNGMQQQQDSQERLRRQQTIMKPQIQECLDTNFNVKGSETEPKVGGLSSEKRSQPSSSRRRECPVPKPSGLIGQVMGFQESERQKSSIPSVVEIHPRRQRKEEKGRIDGDD